MTLPIASFRIDFKLLLECKTGMTSDGQMVVSFSTEESFYMDMWYGLKKGVPHKTIGKRKHRPKPVVFPRVFFEPQPCRRQIVCAPNLAAPTIWGEVSPTRLQKQLPGFLRTVSSCGATGSLVTYKKFVVWFSSGASRSCANSDDSWRVHQVLPVEPDACAWFGSKGLDISKSWASEASLFMFFF